MERECIVQHIGTIEIKDGIVISDPCYSLENLSFVGLSFGTNEIAPGIYDCYVGWSNEEPYGKRVAFMEIVKDGVRFKMAYNEFLGEVGVDSGTMMMSDFSKWKEHIKNGDVDDDWYKANVVDKCNLENYILDDGFSFISMTGFGDGRYDVFADPGEDNKLVRIMVEFIYPGDEEDEGFDIIDFIDADDTANFEDYK